jgi:hypothetical protein
VEEPVYVRPYLEEPYLGVVKEITHQEKIMNPDLGEENINDDFGEEIKKLDLGRIDKISDQGAVMVGISDKKLDLGEVDQIIEHGAQMMTIMNKEKGSLVLGVEVPLLEDNSTLDTLVREQVKISWMEMVKKVTVEVILNMGSLMLGEEVPLIEDNSTLATLGRNNMMISCLEMEVTVFMGR